MRISKEPSVSFVSHLRTILGANDCQSWQCIQFVNGMELLAEVENELFNNEIFARINHRLLHPVIDRGRVQGVPLMAPR